MKIINTTPHPITFLGLDGIEYVVQPCGVIINAKIEEKILVPEPRYKDLILVTPVFVSDPDNNEKLTQLEKEHPDSIIVGSVIAAQAYPKRVFGLVPFERVPPDQKIMRDDKFTVFLNRRQ